jgi:hypothetical protein
VYLNLENGSAAPADIRLEGILAILGPLAADDVVDALIHGLSLPPVMSRFVSRSACIDPRLSIIAALVAFPSSVKVPKAHRAAVLRDEDTNRAIRQVAWIRFSRHHFRSGIVATIASVVSSSAATKVRS